MRGASSMAMAGANLPCLFVVERDGVYKVVLFGKRDRTAVLVVCFPPAACSTRWVGALPCLLGFEVWREELRGAAAAHGGI